MINQVYIFYIMIQDIHFMPSVISKFCHLRSSNNWIPHQKTIQMEWEHPVLLRIYC